METIFRETREFFDGKISAEEFRKKIMVMYKSLEPEIENGGMDSYSYYESVEGAIEELEYSVEEDTLLKTKALVCDIYNNLAHSLEEAYRKTNNKQTKDKFIQFFGMKRGAIFDIIKECAKTGNTAYGIKKEDITSFVVDIPLCGQTYWHLPNAIQILCQEYPYQIQERKTELANIDLLTNNIKQSDFNNLDEHTQKVIMADDIQSMLESLKETPEKNIDIKEKIKEFVGDKTINENDTKIVDGVLSAVVPTKGNDIYEIWRKCKNSSYTGESNN